MGANSILIMFFIFSSFYARCCFRRPLVGHGLLDAGRHFASSLDLQVDRNLVLLPGTVCSPGRRWRVWNRQWLVCRALCCFGMGEFCYFFSTLRNDLWQRRRDGKILAL